MPCADNDVELSHLYSRMCRLNNIADAFEKQSKSQACAYLFGKSRKFRGMVWLSLLDEPAPFKYSVLCVEGTRLFILSGPTWSQVFESPIWNLNIELIPNNKTSFCLSAKVDNLNPKFAGLNIRVRVTNLDKDAFDRWSNVFKYYGMLVCAGDNYSIPETDNLVTWIS